MSKLYNGFNNGRDKSDGVGGKPVNHQSKSVIQEYIKKEAERLTESAIPGTMETETGMIAKQEYKNGVYHGLSAGIELWKQHIVCTGWSEKDATELIEKFLTERNEK